MNTRLAPSMPVSDRPDAKTIGLCMIFKNEAHVIGRCLDSVAPLIDYVLIADTGSTDGTQAEVRAFLDERKLPGQVVEHPWKDFAHNRSRALEEMRQVPDIDYVLMIDADETLVFDPDFDPRAFKAALSADLYNVKTLLNASMYFRPQLFSNRMPYHFRGILHEYLECENIKTRQRAVGFHNRPIQDSARNKNPTKYLDDVNTLRQALKDETDPFLLARYTFYLAQSLRDAKQPVEALELYLRRTEMGFWSQEIYVSLLNAARLKAELEYPEPEVVDAFMKAHQALPTRAEALHGAARYCRKKDRFHQACVYAKAGLEIPRPEEGLFIEPAIYDYALLDEFAVSTYWAGRYEESLKAARQIIEENKFPDYERKRMFDNAAFALAKLDEAKAKLPPKASAPATSAITSKPPPDRAPVPMPAPSGGPVPRVLLAIHAKQGESVLPFYLKCIEALDYPKSAISLYVRTNNNLDRTTEILRGWLDRVGAAYARIEYDDSDVPFPVEAFGVHEWNEMRLRVLCNIRQISLERTREWGCDFYFVVDVDNFIRPATLRELVALNLPIVSPLLLHGDPHRTYANFHSQITANGYFRASEDYEPIRTRAIRGIIDLPVVHCTYLVRADIIPQLSYDDDSGRYDYVIFSASARAAGIPQYLDNRQIYGYLTLEETPDLARVMIEAEIDTALAAG